MKRYRPDIEWSLDHSVGVQAARPVLMENPDGEWVRWEDVKKLQAKLDKAKEFIGAIAKRHPVKPDYWNTCHQCEYDGDEAKEILSELAPGSDSIRDASHNDES